MNKLDDLIKYQKENLIDLKKTFEVKESNINKKLATIDYLRSIYSDLDIAEKANVFCNIVYVSKSIENNCNLIKLHKDYYSGLYFTVHKNEKIILNDKKQYVPIFSYPYKRYIIYGENYNKSSFKQDLFDSYTANLSDKLKKKLNKDLTNLIISSVRKKDSFSKTLDLNTLPSNIKKLLIFS